MIHSADTVVLIVGSIATLCSIAWSTYIVCF